MNEKQKEFLKKIEDKLYKHFYFGISLSLVAGVFVGIESKFVFGLAFSLSLLLVTLCLWDIAGAIIAGSALHKIKEE